MNFRRRFALLLLSFSIAFFTFVSALVMLEVFLRAARARRPSPPALLSPDRALGWDSIPSLAPLDNAGRGKTVYFMGDSFTQGTHWPAEAQKTAKDLGAAFDGFNLGVAGHGTAQSLLKLRATYDLHKPAAVVLLFFAWNDMRDNFAYPSIYYNAKTRQRPFLTPAGESARPVRVPFWDRLALMEPYGMWAEHAVIKRAVPFLGIDFFARRRLPAHVSYTNEAFWKAFYRPEQAGSLYVREAWEATDAAFAEMKKFLDARGAALLVIGIDNAFTVDKDVWDAHLASIPGADGELPLRTLDALLAKRGISFVNALPLLRDLSAKNNGKKVYIGPPGNIAGHLEPPADDAVGRLAGEGLAQVFKRSRTQ